MIEPTLCLADMVRSMEAIEQFIAGMDYRQFAADDRTVSAVVRKLEQIGEASMATSQVVRTDNREIPWDDLDGLRERLIHFYFGVHTKLVWQTVVGTIPRLLPKVRALLTSLKSP